MITLEQGKQIIETFDFAGSVYNIQVINKNSLLTIVNPTTEFVKFNGLTIDGTKIIVFETFRVNQHTIFTAKYVKQYTVT